MAENSEIEMASGRNLKPNVFHVRKRKRKPNKEDRYVIPYGEKEWAVKTEGENIVEYVFRNKKKAIALATIEARKAKASVTIQKRSGKVEKKILFDHKKLNNQKQKLKL